MWVSELSGRDKVWQVRVDTGGTFTDCLAEGPGGEVRRAKVLSTSALRGRVLENLGHGHLRVEGLENLPPDFPIGFAFSEPTAAGPACHVRGYDPRQGLLILDRPVNVSEASTFELQSPEEAPILATRIALGITGQASVPPIVMRLATTRGTNALLERRGSPPALFVTKGFRDLLLIGTQQRPDLFALRIEKPEPLYAEVVEVPERLASDGSVIQPLELHALSEAADRILARGIRCAAVALLHSYRNPQHEQALAQWLRQRGFQIVSVSSELAAQIGYLARTETTVADAYLSPVIDAYLRNVSRQAGDQLRTLHVMTSAGGLVQPAGYRAKDSLLSGPAGGVAGVAEAARRSGFRPVIGFDMGGTSTDASRWDGDFEYLFESRIGDVHLVAPALAIETVAAGGGSVCQYAGGRLRVGPESTGASPGPACYGAGGPLSLTDVNLLLGRLNPAAFEIPIFPERSEKRLQEVLASLNNHAGTKMQRKELLEGFLAIANERMAEAIRRVSIRKGYDPHDHALVAFGGAGGQHACGVADLLGIRTIIVPEDAGLLSAVGLGHARIERFAERMILAPLKEVSQELLRHMDELAEEASEALRREGLPEDQILVRRRIASMRFLGQDTTLEIEIDDPEQLMGAFQARHEELYGYTPESRPVEIVSLRLLASERPRATPSPLPVAPTPAPEPDNFLGAVPVFRRHTLSIGANLTGPALVFEAHSATVIERGWNARVDATHSMILEKAP